MANGVYDDEKQKTDDEFDDIVKHYDDETDHPLGEQEKSAGKTRGLYRGDDSDEEPEGKTKKGKESGDKSDGLYNDSKDNKPTLRQRFNNRTNKLLSNKWMVGFAVGGGSVAIIIGIVVLLLGTLAIPNLASNITEYQFARVTQQMTRNSRALTAEKMAVDASSDSMYGRLKGKFNTGTARMKDAWSKLDKYRPNKIISNFKNDKTLKFNYTDGGVFTRPKLRGVTIGNKTVLVKSTTLPQKLVPGYQFVKDVKFAAEFRPALTDALKANDVGPIIRGQVMKRLRSELGVGLIAWTASRFVGKDAKASQLELNKQIAEKVITPDEETPKSAMVRDASEKAQAAQQEVLDDPKLLEDCIQKGGDCRTVTQAVDKSIAESNFKKVLAFANPVYAALTPICIVYEGSLTNSGGSIDAGSDSLRKYYWNLSSAKDQQQDGSDANAAAIGAYNAKLGDYSGSVPMARAAGNNFTTSGQMSSQAASGGTYSIADVFLGETAGGVVNKVGDTACPVLTDTRVAVVVAAANVIATIVSGGTEGAAVSAAGKGATSAIERLTASFIERFTVKNLVQSSIKMKNLLKDTVKSGAKIAGVTILAKLIVMQKAGVFNNGLEQGAEYAEKADAGGNLVGNDVMQQQFYGRPLNAKESADANQDALVAMISNNRDKSTFDRYFALSNPQSLLSKVGYTATAKVRFSSLSLVLNNISSLLNPVSSVGRVLGYANHSTALAAAYLPTNVNYGNLQMGFSREEIALMKKQTYGSFLENQKVLDASGKEQAINDDYAECFDGSLSYGAMATTKRDGKYYIARDIDGNLIDSKSYCSATALGPHNPVYGDLVFRWRLTHGYENTLDQLIDAQEITEDATNTGGGSEVKIATFNVRGASHTKDYISRANKAIKVIKDEGVGVIGLQEFQTNQRSYFLSKLTNFDIYPERSDKNVHHSVENSIIWDTTKYERVKGGSGIQPDLGYFCYNQLNAPYVKLRVVTPDDSGQEFYVLNTHDPANSDSNDCKDQAAYHRWLNARQHVLFIKSKLNENLPIYLTGDFNSKYDLVRDTSLNGSPYQGIAQNLTYCLLSSSGVVSDAYDVSSGRKFKCPNSTPPGGGGGIDHVYVTNDIAVSSYKAVAKQKVGSDHPMIIFTTSLPGGTVSGSSSKGGWSWPVSNSAYKPLSNCFRPAYPGVDGHTGIDIPVPSGTDVLAANSGTVVKTGHDDAAGNYVIIKHSGGLWSNYQHLARYDVKVNDNVTTGQKIGNSDNTGYSTGPHLHFSITTREGLDSRAVVAYSLNPLRYLPPKTNLGGCK
ncbi:peptidoglycan DD-metalloendopeptidase family protein [Candidatus Saccharibacteria bacterium]|nr:peptidoglycan DD-metalloendopeptidase family protein [Candidatus Saccharibacteria bacterium]